MVDNHNFKVREPAAHIVSFIGVNTSKDDVIFFVSIPIDWPAAAASAFVGWLKYVIFIFSARFAVFTSFYDT